MQRVVKQNTRGKEKGKWYIDRRDYPSSEIFDTREEAQKALDEFLLRGKEKKQKKREQKANEKKRKYDEMMTNQFSDYLAPESEEARLYKGQPRKDQRKQNTMMYP